MQSASAARPVVHLQVHVFRLDRQVLQHAGRIVPDKEGPTPVDVLDSLWASIHGPMRELIMDGEGGVATEETARNYLRRIGI